MEHAIEVPIWSRVPSPEFFGYTYVVRASLAEEDAVFYQLKYGNK